MIARTSINTSTKLLIRITKTDQNHPYLEPGLNEHKYKIKYSRYINYYKSLNALDILVLPESLLLIP